MSANFVLHVFRLTTAVTSRSNTEDFKVQVAPPNY
jgi:hypothetical protein